MAKGSEHPHWKGDLASDSSLHGRARRWYPVLGSCESCGGRARERHHKDGNPANNTAENIARLCNRCHQEIDGRLERLREMGAAAARAQAARTHCPRGHEYTAANTYRHGNHRYCRTCNRESHARRNANQ